MRFNTSVSRAGELKPSLLALLLLSIFNSSSAAAVPAKRDNGTDLINSLLNNFKSSVPVASPEGKSLADKLLSSLQSANYSIPQNSKTPGVRAANLLLVRTNFLYGPPVAGGPAYPSGLLGIAKDALDVANIQLDLVPELALTVQDAGKATVDIFKYNGLKTLNDYTQLYNGEWKNTVPNGPDPGFLTNYTQDLLFSMQRLSASPYQIKRLKPGSDVLQFTIADSTASQISGLTLQQLFQQGRLFYADYRDQKNQQLTTGHYSAACDAYFYIDPKSSDFLPLAIRTNVGTNLIYTPLDSANDWLLAKMMYSVNDFWFAQWNHLAGTHEVLQIVWAAAIRSLSKEHPVYGILNRLMYEVYAIQLLAKTVLFIPGGAVDLVFAYSGQDAENYTTNQYKTAGAGRFQSNYFSTNLKNRGLINSVFGPPIKNFPFYEDGGKIYDAIHTFMASFVESYYSSDAVVDADTEIQAWVKECNGDAKVLDFPSKISSTATLVDVLTHMAHLASTAHHTVNTNELLQISSALPFCPPALYSPLPTAKSASTKPVDFLPKFDKVLEQFTVGGLFARPLLVGTNRTIMHMFDDQTMLGLMNPATRAANSAFIKSMQTFSAQVNARTFDAKGLSQGMPFVWKALDPNVAPYSVAT